MISGTGCVAGRRMRRGDRRRHFRKRASFAFAGILVLLAGVLRPPAADASWVAMLSQATATVNEALDQWEKHTRMLEDWMDQASGMMQPFTELHAGYKELTDTRRLRSMARMGQVYRAGLSDPACWNPTGDCKAVRDFVPAEIRRMDQGAMGLFRSANNIRDGLSWREMEYIVRMNLGSTESGVGGAWIRDDAPPWVRETVDAQHGVERTMARIKYNKVRSFSNLRRSQRLISRYEHLGNDVMRVSRETGVGSGARSDPDVSADYSREGAGSGDGVGAVVCNAGSDATSLVTGTGARSHFVDEAGNGMKGGTVLGQLMELDCAGAMAGPDQPHDPLEPGAHVSPTEIENLAAGIGLWSAQMAATMLEDSALELSRAAMGRQSRENARRARAEEEQRRMGCPQAPMYLNCDDFVDMTSDDFRQAREAVVFPAVDVD